MNDRINRRAALGGLAAFAASAACAGSPDEAGECRDVSMETALRGLNPGMDASGAIQKFVDQAIQHSGGGPVTIMFPPQGTFLIERTLEFDLPEGSVIDFGACELRCASDLIMFDLNPRVSAELPVREASDRLTKRDIQLRNGRLVFAGQSGSGGIGIQAYFMRRLRLQNVYLERLRIGVLFGGKDTYTFSGCTAVNCGTAFTIPEEGKLSSPQLTSNDTMLVTFDNCHISCSAKFSDFGIFLSSRVVGVSFQACSINGVVGKNHLRFSDGTVTAARDYDISGLHIEQVGGSRTAIAFASRASGKGFVNVRFDGAFEVINAIREPWTAVSLENVHGAKFGAGVLLNSIPGVAAVGVTVAKSCGRLSIDSKAFSWQGFGDGNRIRLQDAGVSRPQISVLPSFVATGRKAIPTPSRQGGKIDMLELCRNAAGGPPLLPPIAYAVSLASDDVVISSSAADGDAALDSVAKTEGVNPTRAAIGGGNGHLQNTVVVAAHDGTLWGKAVGSAQAALTGYYQ